MHRTRALLVTLAILPRLLAAQQTGGHDEGGRAALPADSVPPNVDGAERSARSHPRGAANNVRRDWDRSAQGTPERVCVDGDRASIAQSGDFIAGPFALYEQEWRRGYGKLVWEPSVVPSTGTPTLTVRATRLDGSAESRVYEGLPLTRDGTGGATRFFVSGVHLPTAGRWMMVATSGANWGCFLLTVK